MQSKPFFLPLKISHASTEFSRCEFPTLLNPLAISYLTITPAYFRTNNNYTRTSFRFYLFGSICTHNCFFDGDCGVVYFESLSWVALLLVVLGVDALSDHTRTPRVVVGHFRSSPPSGALRCGAARIVTCWGITSRDAARLGAVAGGCWSSASSSSSS